MVGRWVRAARVMGRLLGSVTGTSVQGLTTSKDGSLVQPLTSTGDWHPSLCVARGGMWDICLGFHPEAAYVCVLHTDLMHPVRESIY